MIGEILFLVFEEQIVNRRRRHASLGRWLLACTAAILVMVVTGCQSSAPSHRVEGADSEARWDPGAVEVIDWKAERTGFDPDYAIEASGLALLDGVVYLPAEKYASLVEVSLGRSEPAGVVRLAVPRLSELEGLAISDGRLLICDEAHAAVYEVDLGSRVAASGGKVPAEKLLLPNLGVAGGKLGFEGLAVNENSGMVYLLLERSGDPDAGCMSTIFRLRREESSFESAAEPIQIELDDCTWRLTGLDWVNGELLALKTSFPGFEYQIVVVDEETGTAKLVQDITEMSRAFVDQGFDNNLEGLSVGKDGELYLVSDNRVSGIIDAEIPAKAGARTLLIRVPALKDTR